MAEPRSASKGNSAERTAAERAGLRQVLMSTFGGLSYSDAERLVTAGARSGETFDVTPTVSVRMTMAPRPDGGGNTPAWTLIRWRDESRNPERAQTEDRAWYGRNTESLVELLQGDVDAFVSGRRLHPNGERAFGDFLGPRQRRDNRRAVQEARRKLGF